MPRVSVITPTFNQGRYIGACLDSVVGQSVADIEHLIYDAGSSDDTESVVARYPDPRIIYRREPDSGPADAINKGLAAATGDIVCWLNSDDAFFDRQTLETVTRLFAEHPEIDVVTGDGYYIDEAGHLLRPITIAHARNASHAGMRRADWFLQPATFWRRNDLRLDPALHYAFDWKLFLMMYQRGLSILYLHHYLAKYRLQPGSLTVADNAARKKEICEVLRFAGASLAQRAWAGTIYHSYAWSETLHFPPLKSCARTLNRVMQVLSVDRIVSC